MENDSKVARVENGPQVEGMGNFHFRMPGGGYRYQGGKGFMDAVYDDNRKYFSQPEVAWPLDRADSIRSTRTKLEVFEAIDEFLDQESRTKGWWEDWAGRYPYDLNDAIRRVVENEILRPVYVAMRGRFSREDLVS